MSDKIKKFIECLVPVTACNLKCHYCYVIQGKYRYEEMPEWKYSPEYIVSALTKKRFGGTCFFNICGAGETLLPKEIIKVIEGLLKEGHYVNITTNGTLSKRIDELLKIDNCYFERLSMSFSLHYIELKNKNLFDCFFNNILKVKEAGISYLVQFNMCDDYIPYLEDMKNICLEKLGVLPQVALTRDVMKEEVAIYSKYSDEEYYNLGKQFNSPLWDFTNKNFKVKRKEFCYAGDWAFRLNIVTGDVKRCYCENYSQNIYENIDKQIKYLPIGTGCKSQYCINSSHFLSLGLIPSLDTPTYADLRYRIDKNNNNTYSNTMLNALKTKLYDNNALIKNILMYKIKNFLFKKALKLYSNKKKNKKLF